MSCKNTCPIDNQSHTCCALCSHVKDCKEACQNHATYKTCEEWMEDDVAVFEQKELALVQAITQIELQKKQLEEQSKAMREQLLNAMEQYGVIKFDNGNLKVTYIAPTTRSTIDSTRLKKEMPEIAQQFTKVSQVKATIKIEVK